MKALVDRLPCRSAIIGSECACRGNSDIDTLRVAGIQNDCVKTHTARAGLPLRPGSVATQPGKFAPRLAAIFGFEECSILHTGKNGVRFRQGRLKVPDALELPRVLRAIIKLMCCQRLAGFGGDIVNKFVALTLRHSVGALLFTGRRSRLKPGLPAVVGTLNHLSKPPARLRNVNAIGIDRRSLGVVNLPAREMRSADIPLFALAVRGKNERAFARTNEDSDATHQEAPSSEILKH